MSPSPHASLVFPRVINMVVIITTLRYNSLFIPGVDISNMYGVGAKS